MNVCMYVCKCVCVFAILATLIRTGLPPCGLFYVTASISLQSMSPITFSLHCTISILQGAANSKTPDLSPSRLQNLSNLLREQMKLKMDKHITYKIRDLPHAVPLQNSGCRARGARVEKSETIEFCFDL